MAPKKHAANGRRYSDAEKAMAVQLILSTGGTLNNENWKQIRKLLGKPVSYDVVERWLNAFQSEKTPSQKNESPSDPTSTIQAIDYARATALQIAESTMRRFAERANNPDAVKATEAKDAARVMVEMVKLMQLLQGLPTEIVSVTADITVKAQRKGVDLHRLLKNVGAKLDELPDAPMITEGSAVN